MTDQGIIQLLSTVLVAIITGVVSIIVTHIQASAKSPPRGDDEIALPRGVVIRRSAKRLPWVWIVLFTFVGSVIGFFIGGVLKEASPTLFPPAQGPTVTLLLTTEITRVTISPSPVTPSPILTSTPTIAPTFTPTPTKTLTPTPTPTSTPTCPTQSGDRFTSIAFQGPRTDHPDRLHSDLNLALRGWTETSAPLGLVQYDGSSDPDAPQLCGLFESNCLQRITKAYRVNQWIWDPAQCDGNPHGCPGPVDESWPVTLIGLATTPGEAIYIPERASQIYGDGSIALVLYAEEKRITLGYTREDNPASGYTVHIENVCVDPNLLALYRKQVDNDGWHVTGELPALRNNQALGTAFGNEIQVAIRSRGLFMDPRSRKDWWQHQ